MNSPDEHYGYLFAHFRADGATDVEKIHFSLSSGDTPLRWDPLWGGRPVLESHIGTRGVRDPAIARGSDGSFHILATDLRTSAGDRKIWDESRRQGSRSLIGWQSSDLVSWTAARSIEIAPSNAGMAWAPEVTVDPQTGDFVVFWSSRLYAADDPSHGADSYSRIMYSRTRDFSSFTPAEVMIDTGGRDVIDTALIHEHGKVYRFTKDEARSGGWGIYLERGSSLFDDDFTLITTNIAGDRFPGGVEAPIVIRARGEERWFLFLDQYQEMPQGYFAMECTDLDSGKWSYVPLDEVSIPPSTKHGTILPLLRHEWDRLRTLTELD
ncbi:glycoside hydrolase family 43 protein [Microbacterium sp. PRC9]|uniref:glycoside hydrolase family 43 protein n=1 Tax=Microbacterium sp. PRC9 TaxID=2962591 RepID=UPI002881AC29|nr:glycoside hydrolase family 43 protein [Microbacterium sp. PRC9]MDT0144577.1 glycoside hydrolase family 43 protein [Microbacterium sp. PRC9]